MSDVVSHAESAEFAEFPTAWGCGLPAASQEQTRLKAASPLADASQGGGELQFAVWKHNGGLESASPLADASIRWRC